MLTIEQCKRILNKGGKKYSDEQVKHIREILYQFGKLDIDNFKDQTKK
jgi:hypothetical protein